MVIVEYSVGSFMTHHRSTKNGPLSFKYNILPPQAIFIANRKGFIRLALQRGCDIYVGYCFGNSKLYHCWYDKSGKMKRLSRKLGTGILPIWGRYVQQCELLLLIEKENSLFLVFIEVHLLCCTVLKKGIGKKV